MKKILIAGVLILLMTTSVSALEIQAPEAPERVSDLVSETADSFGQGLWNVIKAAIAQIDGPLKEAMSSCLGAACAVLLCGVLREASLRVSGNAINLACCCAISCILLNPSDTLIRMGLETAQELREYGNLLLPVMTGAMAARGGVTTSAAIYSATALVNSLLSSFLTRLMKPMIYLFLALCIANCVLKDDMLGKMGAFIRWAMTWVLKMTLYLFTGYISITGAVSGSADAAAVRAAKLAISGTVPVVGGILSDASELVLVSAGTLGSAAGVYGMITVLALFSGPFVRIGIQYLLLRGVSAFCGAFDHDGASGLLADFASAMGMVLAMVSTQTMLLLISTMCFMKGVG